MSSFVEQIRYIENRNLRMINRLVCSDCSIGVFGAGGYAYTLIEEMKRLSISIDYCVVDDMYYQPGNACNGVRVYSLLECNQVFKNSLLVVGFGMNYQNETAVMNRIRNQVDTSIEIIDFEDQFLSYFYYLDYSMILKYEKSFQRLYDRLHDDESKKLLVDYVNGRISGDLHSMGRYAPSSSFDYRLDILLNRCAQNKNGSIVNCGAFDGKSAIEINEYLHDGRKIYALECDPENFTILRRSVGGFKNIVPINKGAWSHNGVVKMLGNGQDSWLVKKTDIVEVDDSTTGTPTANEIKVVSLDQLIVEPVAAIAMDIEGSELQALRGAEGILKEYRPSIAVRLYHKPSDFVDIPSFIDSIADLSYRFVLRYDCKYRGAADLTLYAI